MTESKVVWQLFAGEGRISLPGWRGKRWPWSSVFILRKKKVAQESGKGKKKLPKFLKRCSKKVIKVIKNAKFYKSP